MAAAPRFLFWSTLFWTGLFLIAIQRADSKPWLRSPVYLAALALPVLMFPQHYKTGVARRWGMSLAESAAMSLVNETKGEQMTKVLFRDPSQIYHVAPQLRARRLDMFTDGLQDWIGLSETNLFGGRHKPERLTGDCSVTALVQGDDGLEAARVIGQASTKENSIPERLVIVDPTGVVRGVARSSTMSSIINRVFYLDKFSQFSRNPRATSNGFVGYIRDYNPQFQYAVRSADDETLSEEKIPVRVPIAKATKL